MGETWSPSCPVRLDGLRHLTLSFHGLDGAPHTGELVVNASVAREVVGVFRRLWRAGFPLEEMRLVTTADLDAPPTGDGNNTAAYVCRTTRGSSTLSAHAYGLAIDVNPFLNPYRKGDLVLPELAERVPRPVLAPPGHGAARRRGHPGVRGRRLDLGRGLLLRVGPHALLRERPLSHAPDRPRRDVGWAGHECVVPDPAGPLLDPDRAGARRRDPGSGPAARRVRWRHGPRTQP